MSIQEYFGDWRHVLDLPLADSIVRKLASMRQPLCPDVKDVFRAFTLCGLESLRVVIIGQDPYCDWSEGCPTATGVAFANAKDTREESYSPSLKVLMESVIDFSVPHNHVNFDPSLEKWEAQGALMLNSALSCAKGQPGSHALLWRPFVTSFLRKLSGFKPGVVYVLMGSVARSLERHIDKRFSFVFSVPHPAWYARQGKKMPSSLWLDINRILIGQNGYGIEWYEER